MSDRDLENFSSSQWSVVDVVRTLIPLRARRLKLEEDELHFSASNLPPASAPSGRMSHSVKKLTRKLEKLPGDLGR